jgi:hypothetical protein
MLVGVAVYPEGDAPVGQEQLAQLRAEDSPGRARRAAGIDQRLQRMVAEQDNDPVGGGHQFTGQPAELVFADGALPAAVFVHGVEHDAADGGVIERVPGLAAAVIRVGESVTDRRSTGPEVLQDMLGAGHRPPTRVRRHGPGARADRQGRHGGVVAEIESAQHVQGVQPVRGGDVLAFADQRVSQRLVGGDSTFHLVIVVAVDRVPGQPQPGGGEWGSSHVQAVGHTGQPPAGSRQVGLAAVRVPVAMVVHHRVRDPLVAGEVTGVWDHHRPTVEQVDVGAQLVVLAVIGRVPGHHREVQRPSSSRRGGDGVDGLHHRLDNVVGEQLLGPVGTDHADSVADGRVRIGVAV